MAPTSGPKIGPNSATGSGLCGLARQISQSERRTRIPHLVLSPIASFILRLHELQVAMRLTSRSVRCLSPTVLGLQRPAILFYSRGFRLPSEASRLRSWRRKMTSMMTRDNFHRVPVATPIEEELLPSYKPEDYYPVATDQLLHSRYRIVCKLGRGVGSTVWLAKDTEWDGPELRCSMTSSSISLTLDTVPPNIELSRFVLVPKTARCPHKPAKRSPWPSTSRRLLSRSIQVKPVFARLWTLSH